MWLWPCGVGGRGCVRGRTGGKGGDEGVWRVVLVLVFSPLHLSGLAAAELGTPPPQLTITLPDPLHPHVVGHRRHHPQYVRMATSAAARTAAESR